MKQHIYRVEDEDASGQCGFDYESFIDGYYCKDPAMKVIIEDEDFHFAHLCEEHTVIVMKLLTDMDLVKENENESV